MQGSGHDGLTFSLFEDIGDVFPAKSFEAQRVLEGAGHLVRAIELSQSDDLLDVVRGIEPLFLELTHVKIGLRSQTQESLQAGLLARAVAMGIDGNIRGITAGDFDGDGNLDLAVTGVSEIPFVLILSGNGDGTFANNSAIFYPALGGYALAITTGDFSNDDILDLAGGITDDPHRMGQSFDLNAFILAFLDFLVRHLKLAVADRQLIMDPELIGSEGA